MIEKEKEKQKTNLQILLDIELEIIDEYIGDEGEERYLVRVLMKASEKDEDKLKNPDVNWLLFMTLLNSEFVCRHKGAGVVFTRAEKLFSIEKKNFVHVNNSSFAGSLKKPIDDNI